MKTVKIVLSYRFLVVKKPTETQDIVAKKESEKIPKKSKKTFEKCLTLQKGYDIMSKLSNRAAPLNEFSAMQIKN